MDKVVASADEAVADIEDGSFLAVGGFGLCGVPVALIEALHRRGSTGLRVVSNNCGVDGGGLGILLADKLIARVIASYVGENKEFARQFLSGELEVELTPQGTLAERLRSGGVGIPAFFTATGVGTQVADGGLPWRYNPDGTVQLASPKKEVRTFGDREYVLEEAIITDFALVHAMVADRHGNVVFHESARNFNPSAAMSAKVAIVQAEQIVEPGEIDADQVHLPGIFVHRVVQTTKNLMIEKRTNRPRPSAEVG